MIVDSSAIVAIMLGEETRPELLAQMERAPRLVISAVTLYEAGLIVFAKLGSGAVERMNHMLLEFGVTVASFDRADAEASTEAYRRFGKGFHPAGLNFGDCPVYALAELHQMPVLATTGEFTRAGLSSVRG